MGIIPAITFEFKLARVGVFLNSWLHHPFFKFIFRLHLCFELEKERQPIPVFLPGEFHGRRSLAGYIPVGSQRVGLSD